MSTQLIVLSPEVKFSIDETGIVLLHGGRGTVFKSNPIGARIWQGLAARESLENVIERIVSDTGAPLEQVRRDAEQFIVELESRGFVRYVSARQGKPRKWLLYVRLLAELFRYDVTQSARGFRGIRRRLLHRAARVGAANAEIEASVCEAMAKVTPFYWKRVLCLQRSVVTAHVLRAYGSAAEVVIGYRPAPFLGHAWVEVAGKVVNDSRTFQARLQVLDRF